HKLTTRNAEGNSVESDLALAKTVCDFIYIKGANDVALLFYDALQKIAPQNLSNIDSNDVTIPQFGGRAHRMVAHHDWTVRLDDLESPPSPIVIAKNLQQHIPGRAWRKQDVIGLQVARII